MTGRGAVPANTRTAPVPALRRPQDLPACPECGWRLAWTTGTTLACPVCGYPTTPSRRQPLPGGQPVLPR